MIPRLKIIITLFVLVLGGMLFVLSHQVGGLRAFIVSSGSMEPTIATGSLIVTKYVSPQSLQKNDIITFMQPTKERQFITHRIYTIVQQGELPVIKTKGDHNKTADSWVLAGGGVVGKEVLAIPYLGYFFSFSQTKIGMLALILVPSLYIVVTEIELAYKLLTKKHVVAPLTHATEIVSLALILGLFTVTPTMALLNDQAILSGNSFVVELPPGNTGNDECNVSISNTGAGSSNGVTCTSNNQTIITQNNNTSVTNTVIIQSNTDDNNFVGN